MDYHQKQIQKQSSVPQSLYLSNINSLNSIINNKNEGKKHDSYQRYLLKKKGKVFSNQDTKTQLPIYGNKKSSLNISSYYNNCNFCSDSESNNLYESIGTGDNMLKLNNLDWVNDYFPNEQPNANKTVIRGDTIKIYDKNNVDTITDWRISQYYLLESQRYMIFRVNVNFKNAIGKDGACKYKLYLCGHSTNTSNYWYYNDATSGLFELELFETRGSGENEMESVDMIKITTHDNEGINESVAITFNDAVPPTNITSHNCNCDIDKEMTFIYNIDKFGDLYFIILQDEKVILSNTFLFTVKGWTSKMYAHYSLHAGVDNISSVSTSSERTRGYFELSNFNISNTIITSKSLIGRFQTFYFIPPSIRSFI